MSVAERERTAREIARTRSSIRRKHRALKTGKMEEEIALERRFKPIVEPQRHIAKQAESTDRTPVKREREGSPDNDDEEVFEPSPPREFSKLKKKKRQWDETSG